MEWLTPKDNVSLTYTVLYRKEQMDRKDGVIDTKKM